jgi:C1A family cysteine protease
MITTLKINKYDIRFKSSNIDKRDYIYQKTDKPLRQKVDLREWDSLVENQMSLGSCTGNAIANSYELSIKRLYPTNFNELSKLFIYYNARIFEGTTQEDSGASIRDGLKGLHNYGVCKEEIWPYDISKFNVEPSKESYIEAVKRIIPKYEKIKSLDDTLDAVNNNYTVVIGMLVFSSFLDLDKENNTLYATENYDILGGHAVTIVGYDIDQKIFIVKNSFGTDWGINGYFYMSFDYLNTYVFEKWIFDIPKL